VSLKTVPQPIVYGHEVSLPPSRGSVSIACGVEDQVGIRLVTVVAARESVHDGFPPATGSQHQLKDHAATWSDQLANATGGVAAAITLSRSADKH
jgi:hypothetical protein